ncbi:MAG: hypothetical protein ACRCXZ_09390 [Patescibacteria group bacterium]
MFKISARIMVLSFISILGLSLDSGTAMAQTKAPSQQCSKSQRLIKWHLPTNPASYNDFTSTTVAYRCVSNALINNTLGTSGPITPYKEASMAMKLLVNPSILPPVWLPTAFKPMNITGVGSCNSVMQSQGRYGVVGGTATSPKFTLCGDFSSGGIGDDTRSRIATQKTLKVYYPLAPLTNIKLFNRFGTQI